MCTASIFSLVYFVSPTYIITAFLALIFGYPSRNASLWYALPLIVSILIPSKGLPGPRMARLLSPMLDYFDYNEELETSDDELRKMAKEGKKVIVATVPHGVISFVGLCCWVNAPDDLRRIKTAVASSLLYIPILKNVMGIFGLTSASASNLKKHFKKDGVDGSIVVYIGGIAELFKSSRKDERLHLANRKGFIKLALREGVDILPAYFFGNTSVLTVMKTGPLANLSRKIQAALTYFWGKFYLPIPRDEKLLYARGRPLGLPHIPEPTQEDIDKWHAKYCEEITRLFEKYKEKVPMYKHKQLYIE